MSSPELTRAERKAQRIPKARKSFPAPLKELAIIAVPPLFFIFACATIDRHESNAPATKAALEENCVQSLEDQAHQFNQSKPTITETGTEYSVYTPARTSTFTQQDVEDCVSSSPPSRPSSRYATPIVAAITVVWAGVLIASGFGASVSANHRRSQEKAPTRKL